MFTARKPRPATRIPAVIVGVAVTVLVAIVLMASGAAARAATTSNAVVIPPQQENYGQLGALWWKWALSIPYAQNPFNDSTGAYCALGQNGGTWFLAGTASNSATGGGGGPVTRSCTVPAHRKLFFPVINAEQDYPCPDAAYQPAPGQSLQNFLTYGNPSIPYLNGAVTIIDTASDLNASLDGVNIPILSSYRGTSNLFSFTGNLAGDPNLKQLDSCIIGSPQRAVSDGYWLLLAPLSPGQHTLQFSGSLGSGSFTTKATYNLTVQ
jgi:hypothetical protein